MSRQLDFDDPVPLEKGDSEPSLVVDIEGFSGPLDLLLELARRQKVDLHKISVLALAEQYLTFIEQARRFRLELAADYLVMAAWLAFLKSRLLLPEPPKAGEPSAEDMAGMLAFRLQRLELIREASRKLVERNRLGRDVFARGMPEPVVVTRTPAWEASLYDLLKAYAQERQKHAFSRVTMKKRHFWSLVEARQALERLVGQAVDWTVLDDYLTRFVVEPSMRATVRASAFSATLEMVREGLLEVQQERAFAPIWIRSRAA
ncbi:segregation/condensation protein A [Alsobacter sp. SYSU M60028]|uniref:Segregation and condensation protein A n=1 Tax=Alsobacter ponti TaxID=2962936 RepID=A0ABT1LCY3_9HYPH|nr:ScpA family protein [Alsobacter ponti]MCP8939352.1 segregation/condensation protein A [Alsobacter ponti]